MLAPAVGQGRGAQGPFSFLGQPLLVPDGTWALGTRSCRSCGPRRSVPYARRVRIETVLLPGQRYDPANSVCIVVDVLRASSTIVTLLERGVAQVVAAPDVGTAAAVRSRFPGHLLCGEKDGLPPPGFDYGNSPAQFSRLTPKGRGVILATSNGTRVIAGLRSAPAVLVGCLLNRTAVARAAVNLASQRGLDVAVVCSAAYGGSTFVLEDALGAGAIVDAALAFAPQAAISDAAAFARAAFDNLRHDVASAVASAYHARELAEAGLAEDVAYCGRLDISRAVPLVDGEAAGLPVIRAMGPQ